MVATERTPLASKSTCCSLRYQYLQPKRIQADASSPLPAEATQEHSVLRNPEQGTATHFKCMYCTCKTVPLPSGICSCARAGARRLSSVGCLTARSRPHRRCCFCVSAARARALAYGERGRCERRQGFTRVGSGILSTSCKHRRLCPVNIVSTIETSPRNPLMGEVVPTTEDHGGW